MAKLPVNPKDKVLAAIGYIPLLCLIPYIAPVSFYTIFHREIASGLLMAEVFLLALAFIPPIKWICFYLFGIGMVLSLLGMILALCGFYLPPKKRPYHPSFRKSS